MNHETHLNLRNPCLDCPVVSVCRLLGWFDMCELCNFIATHDLAGDLVNFPLNVQQNPKAKISYEFALFERVTFTAKGAERATRGALQYEIPANYCPACGNKIVLKA